MLRIFGALLISAAWLSGSGGAFAADDVAATAAAHEHDDPITTPTASTAPRQAVSGDTELHGYLARPVDAGPGTPGLIVIHEWWGLNDNVRQAAERLAGEGYAALEPLQMPILGNFAEQDRMIPPASVELFVATMNRLGKDVDVKVYAGANHAFANPSAGANHVYQ